MTGRREGNDDNCIFVRLNERDAQSDTGIIIPDDVCPYPKKSEPISDKPRSDSGGNFGRLARYGIMDGYIEAMLAEPVRGVPVKSWIEFFKNFDKTTGKSS